MPAKFQRTAYLLAVLLIFPMLLLVTNCDTKTSDPSSPQDGLALKIFANPDTQAKLTGVTISIAGRPGPGEPDVPPVSRTVSNPTLPISERFTLFDPPCLYQVTVTASLTREEPRVTTRELDVCRESSITIKIDTFEDFWIGENPLKGPESVNAGAAAEVSCGTELVDAPDSGQYPLTATLSEQDGQTISGPFDANVAVSGSFPDPYSMGSRTSQRHFTCVISDGRSTPQTFTLDVGRIPATPTPDPTTEPTISVTPIPGNHLYVATTGNDINSCTISTAPCKTINGALSKASDGMTIHINAGTYTENVRITTPNNVMLVGEGGVVEIVASTFGAMSIAATGITLQDLTVITTSPPPSNYANISIYGGGSATLRNIIASSPYAIALDVDDANVTVVGGTFTGKIGISLITFDPSLYTATITNVTASGDSTGIYTEGSINATISDSSSTGIGGYGVWVGTGSTATLMNVTASGGDDGLWVYGSGTKAIVEGGSYNGTGANGTGVYVRRGGMAELTNVTAVGYRDGVFIWGEFNEGGSVNIEGGSFTGTTRDAIHLWDGGEVTDISNAHIIGDRYAIGCSDTQSVTSLSPGTNSCSGGTGKTIGCTFIPSEIGVCP